MRGRGSHVTIGNRPPAAGLHGPRPRRGVIGAADVYCDESGGSDPANAVFLAAAVAILPADPQRLMKAFRRATGIGRRWRNMAQRRGSLIGSMKAAVDVVEAEAATSAVIPRTALPPGEMTTTAIHIPKATLSLLRRVAVSRADSQGGRPSVSAVLAELVERARAELEAEAARR